jgi:Fe-S cluster assembly protein SufD
METYRYTQPAEHPILVLKQPGEYHVEIAAEGVELTILGMFQTADTQMEQVTLTIVHQTRQTQSRTYLRGVAADTSRLSIVGTIIVEPSAVGTNAFLDERILLLSPTARAEAIPNLQITQNEVKCSHAATISHIPEEQLFYLMSRGLSRSKATEMIVAGFLAPPTSLLEK